MIFAKSGFFYDIKNTLRLFNHGSWMKKVKFNFSVDITTCIKYKYTRLIKKRF